MALSRFAVRNWVCLNAPFRADHSATRIVPQCPLKLVRCRPTMAWGATPQQGAADELLAKAATQRSLCIMPFRRFGADECVALCAGLPSTSLVELLASGHAIGEVGAAAVGQLLAQPSALRRLAIGDVSFGDAGAEALLLGLGTTPC